MSWRPASRVTASPAENVIKDVDSEDTLSSIHNCARIIRRSGFSRVVICTSPYHQPRCVTLFRMLGIAAESTPMPSDRPALGVGKWLYYWFRDCVALPYDVTILAVQRSLRNREGGTHDDA